ncbi:MAG: hypothetical protein ABI158_02585 [Edaphobacter sp.]
MLRVAMVGVALWVGASGAKCEGQMAPFPGQQQQPQPAQPGTLPPLGPMAPASPTMSEQQARMRNTDRQRRLVEDTDKLLILATQLKQDVEKTNKDVMSVDVIKKADEIEKLARSVKERMKG